MSCPGGWRGSCLSSCPRGKARVGCEGGGALASQPSASRPQVQHSFSEPRFLHSWNEQIELHNHCCPFQLSHSVIEPRPSHCVNLRFFPHERWTAGILGWQKCGHPCQADRGSAHPYTTYKLWQLGKNYFISPSIINSPTNRGKVPPLEGCWAD